MSATASYAGDESASRRRKPTDGQILAERIARLLQAVQPGQRAIWARYFQIMAADARSE
jgi:hypothetical protein